MYKYIIILKRYSCQYYYLHLGWKHIIVEPNLLYCLNVKTRNKYQNWLKHRQVMGKNFLT